MSDSKKINLSTLVESLFTDNKHSAPLPVATQLGKPVYAQAMIDMTCPYPECGVDLHSAHLMTAHGNIEAPREGDLAVCMCSRLLQFSGGKLIPCPAHVEAKIKQDPNAWAAIEDVQEAARTFSKKYPEKVKAMKPTKH